jgi:hypothetical protein
MTVFESATPLQWGELDVPLLGLQRDWFAKPVAPPAAFSLAMDRDRLWFIASHRQPATIHPAARPGKFLPELWKYDVAELFITDPKTGRYFEFNLAPNGAWWSCEFKAPRVREDEAEIAMPEVATFSELAPDGSWVAALVLPLDLLRARIDFGRESRVNVTFILNTPQPQWISASDLGDGDPDFHRPERFQPVDFMKLPAMG